MHAVRQPALHLLTLYAFMRCKAKSILLKVLNFIVIFREEWLISIAELAIFNFEWAS